MHVKLGNLAREQAEVPLTLLSWYDLSCFNRRPTLERHTIVITPVVMLISCVCEEELEMDP